MEEGEGEEKEGEEKEGEGEVSIHCSPVVTRSVKEHLFKCEWVIKVLHGGDNADHTTSPCSLGYILSAVTSASQTAPKSR